MIEKMPHVIPVYKQEGETPLACIKRIQKAYPYYKDLPMTYAGRLDPMATGLLVLLAGEKCKQKDDYLALSKTYVVDVAFGVSTDTHDALGVIQNTKEATCVESDIQVALQGFIGKQKQKYPIFSSKTVNGKPLFVYAKEMNIDEINIPEHEVEIFSIDFLNSDAVSCDMLKNKAIERILGVHGDFRQDEVIESWKRVTLEEIRIVRLKIKVGSGTYMRQFAYDLGEKLGFPAIAYAIHRSDVGDFSVHQG